MWCIAVPCGVGLRAALQDGWTALMIGASSQASLEVRCRCLMNDAECDVGHGARASFTVSPSLGSSSVLCRMQGVLVCCRPAYRW